MTKFNFKEKSLPLFLGLGLVFLVSTLLFFTPKTILHWVSSLENYTYDFIVRKSFKPLPKDTPITIVDIDDLSIKEAGRWPWPRKTFAALVEKIYKQGAVVVAFDVTFPDKEPNMVEEIEKFNPQNPYLISSLESLKAAFDYDKIFGQTLTLGESVLGTVFKDYGESSAVLCKPLMLLEETEKDLAIYNYPNYLGNIDVLQKGAKSAGFINATPDKDGVLRWTPLIVRHQDALYPSLGFEAVRLYTLAKQVSLEKAIYGGRLVLEGIHLDKLFIPTDPSGRMLIPYRGGPFTFSYVPAIDILMNKNDANLIKDKLIFIGSTASALGDNRPASIAPIFPGIEVHASVAASIMDQYFPFKPSWSHGVSLLLTLSLGLLFSLIFPFIRLMTLFILSFSVPVILVLSNHYLWRNHHLVLSTVLPILTIFILFVINVIYGYFIESKKGKAIKSIFGQYVPAPYLEKMLEQNNDFTLEGESKEMSVLFSDIRGFTSFSEKMNAGELKKFLNAYFTPLTEVIFKQKGTIDKYVGDLVMAFWGAPLEDPDHAYNAVKAGLEMQRSLKDFNKKLEGSGLPLVKNGVGVNTGIMNVGDMGSQFRKAYTVIGDSVNLASRLEGQTKFYHVDILVGKNTWEKTKERFVYRKLDKIKVKGKKEATEIYCPLGLKEEVDPNEVKEIEFHHMYLEAYFQQNWEAAESGFKELKQSYAKNSEIYDVYLNRITRLKETPPGSDWDGAYVFNEK
ncbi:MAG: CHASE2 domain-containing protein [Rhabdochlamydiaceae bacterium]